MVSWFTLISRVLLDFLCDWSHPDRQVESDGFRWAIHHACSAVPALIRISDYWSVWSFSETVSGAYLDAFEAADAVLVKLWRHYWSSFDGYLMRIGSNLNLASPSSILPRNHEPRLNWSGSKAALTMRMPTSMRFITSLHLTSS